MDEKKEFDTAYAILCGEMYGAKGYSYDDKVQSGKQPEIVRPDLLQAKIQIDNNLRGQTRMIYKKVRLKDH